MKIKKWEQCQSKRSGAKWPPRIHQQNQAVSRAGHAGTNRTHPEGQEGGFKSWEPQSEKLAWSPDPAGSLCPSLDRLRPAIELLLFCGLRTTRPAHPSPSHLHMWTVELTIAGVLKSIFIFSKPHTKKCPNCHDRDGAGEL